MQTQQDYPIRVVALENLNAMCAYITTPTHRWYIEKISRSRVHIGYYYPRFNEHGYEMSDGETVFVLPCYPSSWPGDTDNPRVVMHCLRTLGDPEGEEDWDRLTDAPVMYRDPTDNTWDTKTE